MTDEPRTLAAWLDRAMRRRGIASERELARRIGVSPDTITRIGNGEPTGVATLDKLAAWSDEPVARLVALMPRRGRGARPPTMRLPVYTGFSAGNPTGAPAGFQPFEPPEGAADADRWLCCEVSGECLTPWIEPGDRVIIDRLATPLDGDVVVVDHEGELLVKEVVVQGGRTTLEANGGIAIVPNGDTIVIGVAFQVVKRLRRRRR